MGVTRLVWPGARLGPGELLLPLEVSHHAVVARVRVGEPLEVLNLEGLVATGELLAWEGRRCRVRADCVIEGRGEPPAPLLLGLGVLHTQAFDWAVEKATELGVTVLVPVLSARAQAGRHEARVPRWQRVAEAAVAQCGRSRAPSVREPEGLRAFLSRAADFKLLADFGAVGPTAARVGERGVAVLVGPEGGLETSEVAAAVEAGFAPCRLGPRVLRAETAAVAALVVGQRLAGWL